MRERHNIVGSEVGHARPPIYFRAAVRRRPRRRGGRLMLVLTLLAVVAGGGALAFVEQRAATEAAQPFDVWPLQALAEN